MMKVATKFPSLRKRLLFFDFGIPWATGNNVYYQIIAVDTAVVTPS